MNKQQQQKKTSLTGSFFSVTYHAHQERAFFLNSDLETYPPTHTLALKIGLGSQSGGDPKTLALKSSPICETV